jgi:excisionase family DNA binding protein
MPSHVGATRDAPGSLSRAGIDTVTRPPYARQLPRGKSIFHEPSNIPANGGASITRLAEMPDVLLVREAAVVLRCSRGAVYAAAARGELRSVRIGRRVVIPRQALVDFLALDEPHCRKEAHHD